MIKRYRSLVGLLATIAAITALMVAPAASNADPTLQIDASPLAPLACGALGSGTGNLAGGPLLAYNYRICPS